MEATKHLTMVRMFGSTNQGVRFGFECSACYSQQYDNEGQGIRRVAKVPDLAHVGTGTRYMRVQ
jgi:hypothetical protein